MRIRHATKVSKLFLIVLITLFSFLIIWLATWKSPVNNDKGEAYLHPENINFNKHIPDLELELRASSGVLFHIKEINNTSKHSVNPYFQ